MSRAFPMRISGGLCLRGSGFAGLLACGASVKPTRPSRDFLYESFSRLRGIVFAARPDEAWASLRNCGETSRYGSLQCLRRRPAFAARPDEAYYFIRLENSAGTAIKFPITPPMLESMKTSSTRRILFL